MSRAAIAAAVVAVIAGGWILLGRGREAPKASSRVSARASAGASAAAVDPARAPKVTVARRPVVEREADPEVRRERLRDEAAEIADPDPSISIDPKLAAQAAANQKCVLVARESGEHPERYDPRVVPPPFDPAGWDRDPQAYLDMVEPGRVWQPAPEGSGADPLRIAGEAEVSVPPGERVPLTVIAAGGAPVTFTSFDGGVFDNGLASMTVRAPVNGRAMVAFHAVAGTAPAATVLAASPYHTETVEFTVRVASR